MVGGLRGFSRALTTDAAALSGRDTFCHVFPALTVCHSPFDLRNRSLFLTAQIVLRPSSCHRRQSWFDSVPFLPTLGSQVVLSCL